MWKVYEGITTHKDARSTDDVHELRLLGKKMRYLIDCTRSLYDPEAYTAAIRPLKKLQDQLGDFNDAQVQVERLTALSEGPVPYAPATLLAMGGLIERRRSDALRLREGMQGPIDRFCSAESRQSIERLMASARGGPR